MRAQSAAKSGLAVATRALGNVFLGIAVGLLGYYLLTDTKTRVEQHALAEEFPVKASVVETGAPNDDEFDWEGWESEDVAYWEGLQDGEAFGRLLSPKMRLDVVVVKGTSRGDLMKGPGWITSTDLPGPSGNCGISGHRTTYGAPFRALDRLKPGDTVTLVSRYRVYTYRVKRVFAVTPDRVEVIQTTERPTLTMTACHPPYSARQRLIVQSDLVSVKRVER